MWCPSTDDLNPSIEFVLTQGADNPLFLATVSLGTADEADFMSYASSYNIVYTMSVARDRWYILAEVKPRPALTLHELRGWLKERWEERELVCCFCCCSL